MVSRRECYSFQSLRRFEVPDVGLDEPIVVTRRPASKGTLSMIAVRGSEEMPAAGDVMGISWPAGGAATVMVVGDVAVMVVELRTMTV